MNIFSDDHHHRNGKKGRETVAETIAYVQMNGEHFLFVADKASAVKN